MVCEIWCDGSVINGCRSKVFYGIVVKYEGIENSIGNYCGEFSDNNNVYSEYISIKKALDYMEKFSSNEVIVYTDCRPVIKDINERNKPFKDSLANLYEDIVEKIERSDRKINIIGIDRSDNKKADNICKKVKFNYRNKEYLDKADDLYNTDIISKTGKSRYKVNNHTVDLDGICSCYKQKGWGENDRHVKKCEHEFMIDKYLGFTDLHPSTNSL